MSKFKRSKIKEWGSGATGVIGTTKIMDIDQIKAINDRIQMMSKDPYNVGRNYELKEWQIKVMAEN